MDLESVSKAAREKRNLPEWDPSNTLLAFDPGHTTGWALFCGFDLAESGQIKTKTVEDATPQLIAMFREYNPDMVVLEDYRVYKWRQKHHVGSDLVTSRVIGSIETISAMQVPGVDVIKQPANIAKNFCTNERLIQWEFIGGASRANRHAHDAIRHGVYYIVFGTVNQRRRGQVG